MPAFELPAEEVIALVAFIHGQMDKFAALGGGRRTVAPEDLRTGDAAAGRAYFNGAGKCSGCHSSTGDLAGRFNAISRTGAAAKAPFSRRESASETSDLR